MMSKTMLAATFAALVLAPQLASAQTVHEVKMLNKGADGSPMVFEPDFIRAQPGDTVKFIPTDKGHFAATISNMWPQGAPAMASKLNEELSWTVPAEGVFGIRCTPHFAMGMVMLVQVGNSPVPEAYAKVRLPGAAGKRMTAALEKAAQP
jgi:pseudoazurin